MSREIQVTREGYEKLRLELEDLKGRVRMGIADAIREAKAHGDLRENAAYHEAKLNQQRLDSRIAELEKAVLHAKIVEHSPGDVGAGMGSKVKLRDIEFDDEFAVTIVGAFEADAAKMLISISSPLGEALQGAVPGKEIEVDAPAGKSRYRIIEVE
jgi:transcription elongation factor GreA